MAEYNRLAELAPRLRLHRFLSETLAPAVSRAEETGFPRLLRDWIEGHRDTGGAEARLFSVYQWLLLGGAVGYFPAAETYESLEPHFAAKYRFYGTWLGWCRVRFGPVNVEPVSDLGLGRMGRDERRPPWTDYERRALFQSFTPALLLAESALRDRTFSYFIAALARRSERAPYDHVPASIVRGALLHKPATGPGAFYAGAVSYLQLMAGFEFIGRNLAERVSPEAAQAFTSLCQQNVHYQMHGASPERLYNALEHLRTRILRTEEDREGLDFLDSTEWRTSHVRLTARAIPMPGWHLGERVHIAGV